MVGLIVARHKWGLNKETLYLGVRRIDIVPLLHMRVEEVSKPCHGVFLTHFFKHLQELHRLCLREVDITMYRMAHFLNNATKG